MSLDTNWPDEDERATRADDAVLLVAARLAIGLVADFIGRNLETLSEAGMLATLPHPSNVRHSCLQHVFGRCDWTQKRYPHVKWSRPKATILTN